MKKTIFILLFTLPAFVFSKECLKNRAAFDIGSGSTKLVVAQVDTCKNRINKILLEEDMPVPYRQDVESNNNSISADMIKIGIGVIVKLKEMASKFKPEKYVGVATSAFRTSFNGDEVIKLINKKTGIYSEVISQKTEGVLGFLAAAPKTKMNPTKILIWDIGGGSMQMTMFDPIKGHWVYYGKLASVSYKNIVLEGVMGKSHLSTESPNPIGDDYFDKSLRLSRYYAKSHIPKKIKLRIPNLKVFGIGGVHYYSVRKQSIKNGYTFTTKNIETALKERIHFDDGRIGGRYADTDVSNLALVLGFMKELGINEVTTIKANMAHGILVYPKYWN